MARKKHDFTRTDIITSDVTTGDGVETYITGWMPSGDWNGVRGRWFQAATVDAAIRLFVQYSNDGVTIDAAEEISSFASPTTAYTSISATALPPVGVTERLLVRFGFQARRTGTGSVSLVLPVLWKLIPTGKPSSRVFVPAMTCATKKSTTPIFIPAMEPMDAGELTEVRGTLEVQTITGGSVALACRTSVDGVNWNSPMLLPGCSYQTAVGFHYGGWTSISPGSSTQVQFGYLVKDAASPTQINFSRLQAAIDLR